MAMKESAPLTPGIPIGDLFKDVGLLGEGVFAYLNIHTEISADIEGRVDVDQFDAALIFNLFSQWSVLQAGEDEFVIPPYKFIRPALQLAPAQVEEVHLQGFTLFGTRFVHLFDGLEGEDDIAYLIGFPVPYQFHFAFFIEQQKAVFIRQGFIRFQITKDNPVFPVRLIVPKYPSV